MINIVEAKTPDGKHFAICRNTISGGYAMIDSKNPKVIISLNHPLLDFIFNGQMHIEQRQQLTISLITQLV